MHPKASVFVFCVILLMQACRPLLAQTPPPAQPDAPGLLERLAEHARKVKDTVHGLGETALDFAGAYYEEHIQPVTASYVEWASNAIIPKISDFIDRRFGTSHLGHMG
ncbi:apolipoprotein C-IV [Anabas testudineus]|uniref:Apolipoprotein C-II n=1 Tax=Anabas testudineus TaxID=64144 RepID=A0A7N6FA08_ANATE|nr:apolipoprotein C-IV [Anabas testudineus]